MNDSHDDVGGASANDQKMGLPARGLRAEGGMPKGMTQPAVSGLEAGRHAHHPRGRITVAFDAGLIVQFAPHPA